MIGTTINAGSTVLRRIDDSQPYSATYYGQVLESDGNTVERKITVSHRGVGSKSVSSMVRYDRKEINPDGTVYRDDAVWMVVKTAAVRDTTSLQGVITSLTNLVGGDSTPADFLTNFLQMDS